MSLVAGLTVLVVFLTLAEFILTFPSSPLLYWPQLQDPDFAAGITSSSASARTLPAPRAGKSLAKPAS